MIILLVFDGDFIIRVFIFIFGIMIFVIIFVFLIEKKLYICI